MTATNRFTKIPRPRFGMPYHEAVERGSTWVMKCPLCGFLTPARVVGEGTFGSAETEAHIETHYAGDEVVPGEVLRFYPVRDASGTVARVMATHPEAAVVLFARARGAFDHTPEARLDAYPNLDDKTRPYEPDWTPWVVRLDKRPVAVVYLPNPIPR